MVTFGMMIMSPVLAQTQVDGEAALLPVDAGTCGRGSTTCLPKVYDMGRMTLNIVRGRPVRGSGCRSGVRRFSPVVVLGLSLYDLFQEGLLMRSALVVFAVLVSLSGCGLRKPTSIQIDPALARLVPSDTVALAGVKVDAVRSTPLYRKFIEGKLSLPEMSNDVSEVLVASNGKDVLVFAKTKSGVVQLDEHGRKSEPRRQSGGVPPALREKMRAIPPEVQIWAAGIGAGALPSAVPQAGQPRELAELVQRTGELDRFRRSPLGPEDGRQRGLPDGTGRPPDPRRAARPGRAGPPQHARQRSGTAAALRRHPASRWSGTMCAFPRKSPPTYWRSRCRGCGSPDSARILWACPEPCSKDAVAP